MMPEFIRRMRYSGTAWQVCHASHCLVTINAAIKVRLNTNTLPGTVHNSQSKQTPRTSHGLKYTMGSHQHIRRQCTKYLKIKCTITFHTTAGRMSIMPTLLSYQHQTSINKTMRLGDKLRPLATAAHCFTTVFYRVMVLMLAISE